VRDGVDVEILESLRARRDEMVDLLGQVVAAESPSEDPVSQAAVHALLAQKLEEVGFVTRRLPGASVGPHLYARPAVRDKSRGLQLVVGHLDTVWPVGTLESMPVHEHEGHLFGPGVYDMKGGLVQLVFALGALREHGVEPAGAPLVLINSDEEIGSPESTRYITMLARLASRAFVLEPAFGAHGQLKTSRKGAGRFTLTVRGIAAHAGSDPSSGASAILELSHQVQRLFQLNDPERGLTVNVGTIDGGLRSNVVAPEALAHIGVRVTSDEQADEIEASIRALQPVTEGTSIDVEGGFGRLPMERTDANQLLAARAIAIGEAIGLELAEAGMVGGASDGNTTGQHAATLDGLGPVGHGAHAVDEYVVVSSLPERAALLALLLASPLDPDKRGARDG
jgi:glutamate carboxypeptidase